MHRVSPAPLLSSRALCRLRGGSSAAADGGDYNKMKLSDLQKELRARGLSTKGLKNELIQRLEAHLGGTGGHSADAPLAAKRDAPEPAEDDAGEGEGVRQKQVAVEDEHDAPAGDADAGPASPMPVPMAAPPRVHVDPSPEGFVKVYNSYAIKDKCRAAGFRFDATERAWVRAAGEVLEQLGVASFEDVSPDAVLEMIENTDDAAAPATPTREPESCRAELHDGMIKISGGTYPIKDKLRAAGFKWDGESYSWMRSEPDVTSWISELRAAHGETAPFLPAGSKEYADAVLAAVTELDETSQLKQAVDPVKPVLEVKEDQVLVYNSYDIKDKLRALGFRFSSAERAWALPLEDVLALSPEFEAAGDVDVDKLLSLESPELPAGEGPPPPSLRIVDAEVEVHNSYPMKDQLRALGFRWNVEKTCWTHNVDSVMEAVGVGSPEEITVDVCKAVGEDLVASGTTATTATREQPEVRIEGEEVQVHKSYDVKDKLRALGFNWSVESSCWRMDALQLLERMDGHDDISSVTIDDILALEPAADGAKSMKEPARLEIVDGEALVHNSYDIKDKLRTLGFRWDGARVAWTQPVDQLVAAAGVEDESQLTMDKLLEMEAQGQSGQPKKPYLTCDDEDVCVFNSYDIKEQLRALSFRWDSSRAAWLRATEEVLALLAVKDKSDITVDRLIQCTPPEQGATDENGNLLGAAGASLEMLHDEVHLDSPHMPLARSFAPILCLRP